jgi:hypothetical protein
MAEALSRRLRNAEARVQSQGTGAGFSLGISIYPVGVASVLLASRPSVTQPLISAIGSFVSHA